MHLITCLVDPVLCRPEAKHQFFKRLTPTIYWPKVLLQFTEKHNMRIAWEIHEGLHINQLVDVIDGTQMEEQCVSQGCPLHATIKGLSDAVAGIVGMMARC